MSQILLAQGDVISHFHYAILPAIAAAPAFYGGLASAVGGLFGASKASSSAKRINAQQIALSREQMQFQERMSNTAYQRSTKDLEAAGLNRILALGSPASSPGGAQPPSLKVPGEYVQRGINSAIQNANIGAQIALTKAQARKAEYEGDLIKPKAVIGGAAGDLIENIVTTAKRRGPAALMNSAKTVAEDIGSKIGVIDSDKLNQRREKSQLTLKEITYDPDATIPRNVELWAAAYKKQNGKNPTEDLLRRYAAYIKSIRKR